MSEREDAIDASEHVATAGCVCRRCGVLYLKYVADGCPVCGDAADHLTPQPVIVLFDDDTNIVRNVINALIAQRVRLSDGPEPSAARPHVPYVTTNNASS